MNRRGFLAAALGLALAGCTSPRVANPGQLTLWWWTRGLSPEVLDEAVQRFADVRFSATNVGHDLRPKLMAVLSGDAYIPDMTMVNDDIAGYFGDAEKFVDLNTLGAAPFRSIRRTCPRTTRPATTGSRSRSRGTARPT